MRSFTSALKSQFRARRAPDSRLLDETLRRTIIAATQRGLNDPVWLTMWTATCASLNSPAALKSLLTSLPFHSASVQSSRKWIHNISLKCISFTGIPSTINLLNTFGPTPTASPSLPRHRGLPIPNLTSGLQLWSAIYHPHHRKLIRRLAHLHPLLPYYIIRCHYAPLLSYNPHDPSNPLDPVNRFSTSLIAVSCLASRHDVQPQLISHLHGLCKAWSNSTSLQQAEIIRIFGPGIPSLINGHHSNPDSGLIWLLTQINTLVNLYR